MQRQELTTAEVAKRLGVASVTARLWCRQGRFPNAYSVDTPRGVIWFVPEKDLEGFTLPDRGRPPKQTEERARANAKTTKRKGAAASNR